MVFLGTWLSGYFIVATDAWMQRPTGYTVAAALFGIKYFNYKNEDWKAFFSSVLYLTGMLVGAVFSVYPNVFPAMNPENNLTIYNAEAGAYGLQIGIIWWSIGIVIAAGYFVFLYKTFSGKVRPEAH